MGKRALTSYDTVCWPDRLSFAQEMRESQNYAGVDIDEPLIFFIGELVASCRLFFTLLSSSSSRR